MKLLARWGMKSRGKNGIKDYLIKLGIRLSKKLSFVRNKMEKQLEGEAAKNTSEMLKDKKVKCTFSKIPLEGFT